MEKLKGFLEQKMTDSAYVGKVLFKEASLDEKEKRNFKLKIKLVESGERYDEHECIVSVKSDEQLSGLITERNLIKLMRIIEEPLGFANEVDYPHILKVVDKGSVLNEDKTQMDITFQVISNIERL